jgi:plasmid stabilization system protein ParE
MGTTQRRRRVVWTRFARAQLVRATDFIAFDSPIAAARLIAAAEARAESLALLSERGRIAEESPSGPIREIFLGRYRLIYRVADGFVFVVGFMHGARDWRP